MRGYGLSFLVSLLCLSHAAWAGDADKTIEELRKEADGVLKRSFVKARADIGIVFDLADRLAAEGQSKEALRYYEAGLKRFPLGVKQQLKCAELLAKLGRLKEARRRAGIVAKLAEDDALVVRAMGVLGRKVSLDVPAMEKLKGSQHVLVLVPMGEVDVLVLGEVQAKVKKTLGIEVLVRKLPLKMPPPKRDPMKELAASLRKTLAKIKAQSPEEFDKALKKEKLTVEDLKDDDAVAKLFISILESDGDQKTGKKVRGMIERVGGMDKQWDAGDLLKALEDAAKPYVRANVRFVGVTRKDIYADDYAFLLGQRIDDYGVMSYRRFTADFAQDSPSRDRLISRTFRQVLASAGHVFGVGRCGDPTCPRAYPHSVEEHDKKTDTLCPECKEGFDKAFGRAK